MKKIIRVAVVLAVLFLMAAQMSTAGQIKDTESASHSDAAAGYDIVDTYSYPGFKIIQFNLAVLSHYSYMLVSDNKALIVDPGRDVFKYLEFAEKEKADIVGVLLSHSHADFVAGHAEFIKRTGCPVFISRKADAGYPHKALEDGSIITVGQAVVKVMETPGHTLDCTTSVVYSKENQSKALAMFSGDTIFVGSIGRPDLMGGTISAAALASMAFDSWHEKLSKLADDVAIYPAHGAGSLCGAHLRDEPFSTIGMERQSNPYLKLTARSDFIAAILEGLPDAPQYFKYNAAMNRSGPAPVSWDTPPQTADLERNLTAGDPVKVVDIRDAALYAAGHIPNSINIGLRGRFETWVGIMIPWGSDLVLTGGREELDEACYRLNRVGYAARALVFDAWAAKGLPLKKVELIEPAALMDQMKNGNAPVIVDVRLPNEWMGLRIGQVVNMPLNQLEKLSSKLDASKPVIAVCNSAYRSSLALGILEKAGFDNATSLKGGSQAWIDAGYPVFGSEVSSGRTATATIQKREIKLPGRISPAELKSLIMDLPGTFELVDIRPASFFADYHLPGSINVDLADLLSNPAYLSGAGPLIIIDRDGTLSMMAAGMLFQKTKREINALRGGLEAYWQASDFPGMGASSSPAAAPETLPATSPPVQPSQQPERPKKKSAGC